MRTKAAFLIGGAVGYVLGTRAGREQFEKIRAQATRLWEDERVQEGIADVEQRAGDLVREKGPEIKEKVSGAVRSATDSVRPKSEDSSTDGTGSASY
ncbi:YtxH domain-containing protein [Actinotalea sp. K2]|uniref:YtxH domain-containing protein n=1 Tax=Actinotalea sp. K2 TaxID=2939438 RepID=UPI00201826D0|nr:YtxH domain-containing protein [Actinotalea sp. K2]MCL3860665.1 YtxH domain-containing protein [Actinotalea sp. K2]